MYEKRYYTVEEARGYLGIGRHTCIRLCNEKPYGFPAVKIGRRYQIDAEKLALWKDDWYAGKFTI